MRSSRRLVPLLLALAAFTAPAALAKPASKCADGAEKAGCKLPVNATYSKELPGGSGGSASITVASTSFGVTLYAAEITCKKFAPANGSKSQLAVHFRVKPRPVVGKTYSYKESESRNEAEEGGGTSSSEDQLTVSFKSARQAVVTLHEVSTADGEIQCDGSATWALKRQ